ncbi:MAG TPA: type II secretion system protein [Sumerlaeia bacterium]|nr:type II secretion system protein [Sumerlaeia bacterium]
MFSHRRRPTRRRPLSRTRAFTLVEALVAAILTAVTVGVVLGLLIDTRRACQRGQKRLAMRTYAETAADEIGAILETSVAPDSLDDNATTPPLAFSPAACTVISAWRFDGKDFYLTAISNVPAEASRGAAIRWATTALDDKKTPKARETAKFIGAGGDERLSARVDFMYATDIDAIALEPVFQKQLGPGEYPKLVRIHVVVEDVEGKMETPFEMVRIVRTL